MLSSSSNNIVVALPDGRALRIPQSRDAAEKLKREVALLGFLAERVTFGVPRYLELHDSGVLGRPVGVFEWLPGRSAQVGAIHPDERASIGRQLGRILRELHAMPLQPCLLLGTRVRGPESLVEISEWYRAALEERSRAAGLSGPPAGLCAALSAMAKVPPWEGQPVLVHGDFAAKHILLGPNGGVCAVLDFGEAAVCEPAADVGAMLVSWGPEVARCALAECAVPDPARVMRRAVAWALITLFEGALELLTRRDAPGLEEIASRCARDAVCLATA